jgi:Arc/MetJ-type ribon-helix-helix transcriptional regulator
MTIHVNARLERLIDEKVRAGLYPSAEALVVAALAEFLNEAGDFAPGELAALVKVGTDELDQGQVVDGLHAFDEIRRKSASHRAGNGP